MYLEAVALAARSFSLPVLSEIVFLSHMWHCRVDFVYSDWPVSKSAPIHFTVTVEVQKVFSTGKDVLLIHEQ